MAGVQFTPRDTTPGTGWNESFCRFHNFNQSHELRIVSSATASLRSAAGIRFPVTPPTFAHLRQVFLNITMGNDTYDDLHCRIRGHKVANSGAFIAGSATANPRWRFENEGTTAEYTIERNSLAPLPFMVPDAGAIQDIVEEIMAVPGWVPGNPITLLFYGFDDREKEARLSLSYTSDFEAHQPYMFCSYGSLADDPVVTDLLTAGDSWAAYPGHAGYTKTTITLPYLFPNVTFSGGAAGMGTEVAGQDIYNGDNVRGWTAQGVIQDELEAKYGDENLLITRHQHAFAGSTAAQWAGGIITGQFWGDESVPGTFRFNLKNPRSFTEQQIIYLSLGGNDVIAAGKGARIVWEEDPEACEVYWLNELDKIEGWIRESIDEINRLVQDQTRAWIVLPGYSPFCVISKNAAAFTTVVLAASNAQDVFRQVWSLDGYALGGRQYFWDSISSPLVDGTIHAPGLGSPYEMQSTLVQFAGHWQRTNHPEDCPAPLLYNPSGNWWDIACGQVGFPFPAGPLAHTTWQYNGQDGWEFSFRNITDITINQKMMMLDAVYARIAADYDNVIYTPSWDKMPVDTVLSADPSSPYAQSPALYWVEGIHFNEAGYRQWLTAPGSVLDQMDNAIPFLPGYEEPPPGDPGDPVDPVIPTPRARTTSFWKFLVGAGNAETKQITKAIGRNLRFELKGQDSVSLTMNIESPEHQYIAELETDLKIYHRGTKLFRGRFGPSSDKLSENGGTTEYAAVDYRGRLERFLVNDDDNAYWYGEDVATIVKDLIGFFQTREGGNLGIVMGFGSPSLGVTRQEVEVSPGENIYSAIQKMAESKELGFDWEIDPSMHLNLYVKRGTLVPKNLEYRGTIKGLTRNFNTGDFANAGRLSGGDTVLPEILEAPTLSTDMRGRWEAALTWPDAETQELLNDRGQYLLEQVNRVPVVYNVQLRQGWWGGPTHLWLGDAVALRIKKGRLDVTEILRIHAIDIDLDEHGGEEVSMELK